MTPSDLESLLAQTQAAVQKAGRMVRANFRKPMRVEHKGRIDLVTDTDRAVEDELKAALSRILPGSGFLAEETESDGELNGATWIIDPVDGTTNFAHGVPFTATSVALWDNGRIQLGVVNLPLLDECFTAIRGQGAKANGASIHVRDCSDLAAALAATGFPYAIETYAKTVVDQLERVLLSVRGVRRCGAAAVDLAYLAAGRYDVFYEYGLRPWDVAAGWLLVEEAGGRVSTMEDADYALGSESLLASNTLLHEEIRAVLTGAGH